MASFSLLRFQSYARDLEAALLEMSRETKMGGLTELKQELGDVPGIETLNVTFGNGQQYITLNGRTVAVGVLASISEIRKALGLASMTDTNVPAPTPVPPNQMAQAAPVAAVKPAKSAVGGFAASIKAMIDTARAGVAKAQADGLAKVQDAVNKLNDAATQTAQVSVGMAKSIEEQANAALAELGQISNFPPEGEV